MAMHGNPNYKLYFGLVAFSVTALVLALYLPLRQVTPVVLEPAAVVRPAPVSDQTFDYHPHVWRTPIVANAPSWPREYTVRNNDTLSSIAQRIYGSTRDWTVIYWANRRGIRFADLIYVGQRFVLPASPATPPAPPAVLDPKPPAPVHTTARSSDGIVQTDRDSDARHYVAPSYDPPDNAGWNRPITSPASTYTGQYPGGAFGQCVVARESGGNVYVMNSTGHYGLYQFSASTWVAYGGNPATFGTAGIYEQNQVFINALAAGGQSNWSPYDGC